MMTIALMFIKSLFSKAINVFMRYPLQIILVLLCLYAFWQKTRYDEIFSDYEAYKASIVQAVKLQQIKNEILRKKAEQSLKDAELIYDNNLKAIKNEYLKKQKLDSVTISNLRNRLRDQLRTDTFIVSNAPADTETSAEVWRNSYSAINRQYETLKQACAITTNDFNLLREWADIACNQVGCK